jgi:hypothetical protein
MQATGGKQIAQSRMANGPLGKGPAPVCMRAISGNLDDECVVRTQGAGNICSTKGEYDQVQVDARHLYFIYISCTVIHIPRMH